MKFIFFSFLIVWSLSLKGQQTTQGEHSFLLNSVKMVDESGGILTLTNYSLIVVSSVTIDGVNILVRKMIRNDSSVAGYSIRAIHSQPYSSSTSYFALPAIDGAGSSHGWGIFFDAVKQASPEVSQAINKWMALTLSGKL